MPPKRLVTHLSEQPVPSPTADEIARLAGGGGGGGGGGLVDGDYGDITVSGSGTAMTIDANAVTLAKLSLEAYVETLLASTTAAQARSTLQLGSAATASTGDFATAVHTHPATAVTFLQTGAGASSITLDAYMRTFVSAEQFGFSSGNTAAGNFTALKNACATGFSVQMPRGTFPIACSTSQSDTITLAAGQCLRGHGLNTILSIDWTGKTSTDHFLFDMGADGSCYEDFTVNGNRWTGGTPFNLSDNTTFRVQLFKGQTYTKVKNFLARRLSFKNLPGGYPSTDNNYNPGGQQILEGLTFNGVCERSLFDDLDFYDCDSTFHILGGVGQGITSEAYWSNGNMVRNFRNAHSTTFARGQWVALGVYGARDTIIDGAYLQGARLACLNIEWADRYTARNVTCKDGLRAGIQFFGAVRDAIVDRPVLDNCGAAFSAPYAFDSTAAPIRFNHGSWFENGLAANPSNCHVYLPRFSNIPAYTTGSPGSNSPYPVYCAFDAPANLAGAIEGEPRNLRITIDEEALRIAGNAAFIQNSAGLQPMAVNVVVEGLSYGAPIALTAADSNMSAAVTKSVSGYDTYYTVTDDIGAGPAQYHRLALNLGVSGIFALRGKIKYANASEWNIAVSPIDGGTVRWQTTFDRDPDDWIEFGAIFQTAEASSVKIINIKGSGTATCQIKGLQIACLARGTVGDADFISVSRGRMDAVAAAVPAATRYVPGDIVWNTAPGRQSPLFWVNVDGGAPGTFHRAPTLESLTTGITATGTTQGDAYGLGTDLARRIVIGTTPSGTGVRLPTTPAYALTTIYNGGANALNVYPGTSGTIDNLSADTAISIAAGGSLEFFATAANVWRSH